MKNNKLKEKLDYHYRAFDKTKLEPDPLQFPHLFTNEKDIEAIAFISSIFAYGNVKQIIASLEKIVHLTQNKPFAYLKNFNKKKFTQNISITHRFYSATDVQQLFALLSAIYSEYGSLKNLFIAGFNYEDDDIKKAITNFSNYFLERALKKFGVISNGLKFMFSLPEKGSACKRMNLFLRWMIRKDELDFGLWKEIPTSKLIIPVDTHVARICRQLKLTNRKNVTWKMAEEITENLKMFDPNDPVKYDFAICHIGIRKLKF